jgi:hypothetical protein
MTIPATASGLVAPAAGGWGLAHDGWPGLAVFGLLPALAPALALKLARVPPPAHLRPS